MLKKKRKEKSLIWVYPPDKWETQFNQTFLYGSTNKKAKLFYKTNNSKEKIIKVFQNGNFAQVVKLPKKKNTVQLVQILNHNKTTITREITVKLKSEKQTKELSNIMRLPRHYMARNEELKIVIDPGHGGKEHGTHSPKGIPEKTYNLEISKILANALHAVQTLPAKGEARPEGRHATSLQIHKTRTADKFISLDNRIKFANKKKCNLFISIHHNALPDNEDPLKHRGIGVYFTHEELRPLAKQFLENICHASKLKKYGVFKRDFRVIKQNTYAGILIECGFLTHPIESELVTSKTTQKKIVAGIIKTITSLY